jgi:hypothetical protein
MLDDADYELVLGQDQGFSENSTQIVEELTEAPNQSSEASDTPAPNPTPEGKPRCITQYLNFTTIRYLYIKSCIKSRSWNGTLDALILGTNVLHLSPYRLDALLIGLVEVVWFPVTRAI